MFGQPIRRCKLFIKTRLGSGGRGGGARAIQTWNTSSPVCRFRETSGRARGSLPSHPRRPWHRAGKPAGNRRTRGRLTYPLAHVRGDVTADGGPIGLPPSSPPAGTPPPPGWIRAGSAKSEGHIQRAFVVASRSCRRRFVCESVANTRCSQNVENLTTGQWREEIRFRRFSGAS